MTRNELLGQLKRGNFNMLKQFPGLSSDESLMLDAYQLNPGILNHIDKSLINNENFFYELALIDPEVVKGTPYAGQKDFMKRLILEAPSAAKYMQQRLFEDPVFLVELVSAGAESAVLHKMEDDPEIKNRLQKLPFGEYRYVDSYEVSRQKEMIERGEITEELSNNSEFMAMAISRDISYIEKMGDKLIADRECFNNIYRNNKEKFDEYIEDKAKDAMKDKSSGESINEFVKKSMETAKENRAKGKKISVGHITEKGNSSKIIQATAYAREDELVDEFIEALEKQVEEKMKEALESTDQEKARKAKLAVGGLTKKIADAKEKSKTEDGRKALLKENENNPTLTKLGREKERRENSKLPRSGIVDPEEVLKLIENKNASVKTIDDKFTKAFKGYIGKIDAERGFSDEKKISNHLEYFIKHPDMAEKYITNEDDRELLKKIIAARIAASEREANAVENPQTVDGNYRENIRNQMKDVVIDVLREEEENLEQQLKFAETVEERKEIGSKIKGLRTRLGKVAEGKSLDYNVKLIIKNSGNEVLQDLVAKDAHATVIIVTNKIKNGEYVDEGELKKAIKDSERFFKQECPELYEKVKDSMLAENPGNQNKLVLEYLTKNMDLLEKFTPEDSKERENAGRWLKPAQVLQDAIEGNKKEVDAKENENTRDEEK